MTGAHTDVDREIEALHKEVEVDKLRLTDACRRPKEPVEDYILKNLDRSEARFSELFGAKDDLILIHNMGAIARPVRCGPKDLFDAGDDYRAVCSQFDPLEGGVGVWNPRFDFDEARR